MNITVGTDPEMFFTQPKSKNVYPARLVFDAQFGMETLEVPFGSLIVDGAALEIQPLPSLDPEEVVTNLRGLLQYGLDMADAQDKRVAIHPELPFDIDWCKQDASLGEFGCAPDKSAWGEGCKPATIDATQHPWRYAGCHIHLGVVDDPDYFARDDMITHVSKALDRTVGLASMVLSGNRDKLRRGVYGRPGIFRHQPWGMEYRTPSNMILRSPQMMQFIFGLAQVTIELANEHYDTMRAVIPDDVVVQILRSDDLGIARELYMRMANVFCLDRLPRFDSRWEVAWFGQEAAKAYGSQADSWEAVAVTLAESMDERIERLPTPQMPEMMSELIQAGRSEYARRSLERIRTAHYASDEGDVPTGSTVSTIRSLSWD